MKFEVDRDVFSGTLQRLLGITKKTPMPVLRNVLIEAGEKSLTLSATDLELSLRTTAEAVIKEAGSITVPMRRLYDVVRSFPDSLVRIDIMPGNKLAVRCGRSRFEIPTIPAEDFPALKSDDGLDFRQCARAALERAISKTLYASPAKGDAFMLEVLFLLPAGDAHRFMATDGHRMAYSGLSPGDLGGLEIGRGLAIPRRGAVEMTRMIEEGGDIFCAMDINRLILKAPGGQLDMQLMDDDAPAYESIVPEGRVSSILLDREPVIQALKRLSIISSSNQGLKMVRVMVAPGGLQLTATSDDTGTGQEELDVDYDGAELEIYFQLRYLLEAIEACGTEKIEFRWMDKNHGAVITEPKDRTSIHVVMPVCA